MRPMRTKALGGVGAVVEEARLPEVPLLFAKTVGRYPLPPWMCSTQQAEIQEAPGVSGHMPEGHVKVNPPKAQDALHVAGGPNSSQSN